MSEDAGINDEIISKAAYGGEFLKLEQASSFAAPLGSVCPDCASLNLRSVRREYGIKGQWNYWWIESMCCSDCGRINIPREPGTPNEKADRSQP